MRNDEAGVEGLSHAVAGVVAHDSVVEALGVGLDDAADDVDLTARANRLDPTHERVARAFDEEVGLFVDGADLEHGAGVSVDAVLVGGDVDVDDVPVSQGTVVGDAVADHLVDRGTDRLGEAHVSQARWVGVASDDVLVSDPVELVRRDAGGDSRRDGVDRAGRDASGFADPSDGARGFHVRGRDSFGAVVEHVLGAFDMLGNRPHR